jgi:hypothetical protein
VCAAETWHLRGKEGRKDDKCMLKEKCCGGFLDQKEIIVLEE